MTLKEHYKLHSRKSIKPYTKLLLLAILYFAITPTFAKYTSLSSANSLISVAKFSIKVNDEEITNEKKELIEKIKLINCSDDITTEISASDECYFDIIMNPSSTEVSISCNIFVDLLDSTTTLPEGTKITKYEIYKANNEIESFKIDDTQLTINEDIYLSNKTSLNDLDIRKYRIYCKLPTIVNATNGQEYSVIPKIIIKQNIQEN